MKTDIEGISVAPASNSFEISRTSRENSLTKVNLVLCVYIHPRHDLSHQSKQSEYLDQIWYRMYM